MMRDTSEVCMEDILAPLVDGTLSTDGYLHIQKGDVLVMRYKGKINKELANEIIKLQDVLGK